MSIFGKSAQDRVDDVIDRICRPIAPPERAGFRAFLLQEAMLPTAKKAFKETSERLSLSGVGGQGDSDERLLRRCIMLLGSTRGTLAPRYTPTRVQAMDGNAVRAEFTKMIADFHLYAMQETGKNAPLAAKLLQFKAHPKAFMRENNVFFFGSAQDSGLVNTVTFDFIYKWKSDAFALQPQTVKSPGVTGGLPTVAVSIPAVMWDDVPGRGNNPNAGGFGTLAPTECTGADMVISTQFSGCTLCFKQVGGRLFAAHIMPSGALLDGAHDNPRSIGGSGELARQLINSGNFSGPGAGGGNFYVYGVGESNIPGSHGYQTGAGMYVFGVRQGDTWKIYSQQDTVGGKNVERLF